MQLFVKATVSITKWVIMRWVFEFERHRLVLCRPKDKCDGQISAYSIWIDYQFVDLNFI